jgi:hypothetical protein
MSLQNLSSLAAGTPLWLAIFIAAASLITALGGLAAIYRVWVVDRKKTPSEIHLSNVQMAKIKAETVSIQHYGDGDGTLIEQVAKAAGQAWSRIDALEDEVDKLDADNKELRRTIRGLGQALDRANGTPEIRLIKGKDE